MKISNNWLKDYIKTDLKSEKIGEYLTDIGLEVEGIEKFESITGSLEGIVVGKVLTCEKPVSYTHLDVYKRQIYYLSVHRFGRAFSKTVGDDFS